jgi:phenylacetate-coenzyme A ligase PaaK-like adenylate-forming protein
MTLHELRSLVRTCTAKGGSPFYRRLYGLSDTDESPIIDTWDAWQKLPAFGKEHLTRETLPGRVFPPWSNIDTILASSGTSGNPPVYSSWVLNDGYSYRYQYHDFKRAVLTSMPTPFQQDWIVRKRGGGPVVILDPRRAAASVKLAAAAGVDSMLLILHHVPLITEDMIKTGLNKNIRFIEIAGETSSLSLFRHMRTTFPNATICAIYGSSDVETSPIGIPCRPMTDEDPRAVYHVGDRTHLELIDTDTGDVMVPYAGAEGELLISAFAGSDATFPLVRYRIGDTIRVVEAPCEDHGDWSFEILGRSGMDFLKVPGGILRADEVARVLRELSLPDVFQLHRYEHETEGRLKVKVELLIDVGEDEMTRLAAEIAERLRISAAYTYAQAVRDGMFEPLVCRRIPLEPRLGKAVRMVRH